MIFKLTRGHENHAHTIHQFYVCFNLNLNGQYKSTESVFLNSNIFQILMIYVYIGAYIRGENGSDIIWSNLDPYLKITYGYSEYP